MDQAEEIWELREMLKKERERAEGAENEKAHIQHCLFDERSRRKGAERERDFFRRDFEIAESHRLCNAYELARMKIGANALASELEEIEYQKEEYRRMYRQEARDKVKAEKKRDRYASILELAARFAAGAPDTQIKDDGGEVMDGRWLAAHIQDVLEG